LDIFLTSPDGGRIFYTIDGSTPDYGSQSIAGGEPITLASPCILTAIAVKTDIADSEPLVAEYDHIYNWGQLSAAVAAVNTTNLLTTIYVADSFSEEATPVLPSITTTQGITLTAATTQTITRTLTDALITVNSGGKLTLTGSLILDGGHNSDPRVDAGEAIVKNEGNLTLAGSAVITGGDGDSSGVYNGGTFTMDGGEISGNYAFYGGGVNNYNGTFTMNGGEISENLAIFGGGVFNIGDFTMSGGTISRNEGNGGGVYNGGTFTMSGLGATAPIISGNNNIDDGGGVLNYGGAFIMSGGTISADNTAYRGASLYNNGGTAEYGGDYFTTYGGPNILSGDNTNLALPAIAPVPEN
jgi:hypothetical protein